MRQQRPENSNRYQKNNRNASPLIDGVTALKILCALLIAANLWLLYGIFSPSQGIMSYHRHRQQVMNLEQKIQSIRMENQKLFRKIRNFKTDPGVRERAVREQLGWVHEGELVVEFLPPEKDPS